MSSTMPPILLADRGLWGPSGVLRGSSRRTRELHGDAAIVLVLEHVHRRRASAIQTPRRVAADLLGRQGLEPARDRTCCIDGYGVIQRCTGHDGGGRFDVDGV